MSDNRATVQPTCQCCGDPIELILYAGRGQWIHVGAWALCADSNMTARPVEAADVDR